MKIAVAQPRVTAIFFDNPTNIRGNFNHNKPEKLYLEVIVVILNIYLLFLFLITVPKTNSYRQI